MIQDFAKSRSGNIALLFALLLVPIIIGAGMGLDMMRAGQVRSKLHEASDSGLLAAARAKLLQTTLTDVEAKAIARRYFDANGISEGDVEIDSFDFVYDTGTQTFTLTVIGRVKTTLLGITGREWMPLNIVSEAKVAPPRALEVVLVLDNTTSMDGQKIIDLRAAADLLVDSIMDDTDNEVLVGLVPFSNHVNMGLSRIGESWIDVPADTTWDDVDCDVDAAAATAAGCSNDPYTCYDDGIPYACTKWQCPGDADPPTTCTTTTVPLTWQGCVGSRSHPLNIEDGDFLANGVPGTLDGLDPDDRDCSGEVLPMTTNKLLVQTEINAMNANGETYIPGGLTWGLRLLSAESPFTEGKSYSDIQAESGIKALVLMTDGANTLSPNPWDGIHYSDDVDEANTYTLELCDEIKGNNIVLYTIAFDITDPDLQTLMSDCATDPSAFYNADNAAELSDAFGAIGSSLTELALTK